MSSAQLPEPPRELNQLTEAVIGASIEVHKHLGPGLLEIGYENALAHEFGLRSVEFVRQPVVEVRYKGVAVCEGRLDFLVGHRLIVELKAVDAILPIHEAQVLAYLKITRHQLALLINFNTVYFRDGIRRMILS